MSLEKTFKRIAQSEGAYNHPDGWCKDLGDGAGWTNKWGATSKNTGLSKEQLMAMTESEAQTLFEKSYWVPSHCNQLHPAIAAIQSDVAYNSGHGRANKLLQRAVDVAEDGAIGPATLAAVEKLGAAAVVEKYSDVRRAFYRSLKQFDKFGKGWLRRVDETEEFAKTLL